METTPQILKRTLSEKKAQLDVKLKRKASIDAEVTILENEVTKLEAHIKKAYPTKEGI